MKFIIQLFLLLFATQALFAQKQSNIWYFGSRAGIDFNSGSPVVLKNSAMLAYEGSATICNAHGQLLFYTEGTIIWNRKHKAMPNGSGLLSHFSTTQSSIIIPFPKDTDKYYVFTLDVQGKPDGLRYSIVDMALDSGYGDVTKKNELLLTPVTEKITAVKHKNGIDIWVIVHKMKSRDFLAYLITSTGISKPVISTSGAYHGDDELYSIGYLKASPNGKRLAYASSYQPGINCQVFDFDNLTGKISKPLTINNIGDAYGLEFSPSGKLLYTSGLETMKVLQYNLDAGDSAAIVNSRTLIYEPGNFFKFGSFQLAPDGKIYIACIFSSNISIIHMPNEPGTRCKFEVLGLNVEESVMIGLPNFIQSYFDPEVSFTFEGSCPGEPTGFKSFNAYPVLKWQWDFGDPTSGNNWSNKKDPTHIYSKPGDYKITLIATKNDEIDTVINYIKVNEIVNPDLGPDILTCDTSPILLKPGTNAEKYLWSTGSTAEKITITRSGKYWVRADKNGCVGSDTINVTIVNIGNLNLGRDTVLCADSEIEIKSNREGVEYTWSNGSKNSSISVNQSGLYWLRINSGECERTDSINITVLQNLSFDLGKDTLLCEGDTLSLDAKITDVSYLWSTGETTQKITVSENGKYWVRTSLSHCSASDTILVDQCGSAIYMPDAFSPNADGTNDSFYVYGDNIMQRSLVIYNRWGECIFESDNMKSGWDGNFKNRECPQDYYFWILKYKRTDILNAETEKRIGSVRLLR